MANFISNRWQNQDVQHGDIIEMKATGRRYSVYMCSSGWLKMGALDSSFYTEEIPAQWAFRIVFRTRQTPQLTDCEVGKTEQPQPATDVSSENNGTQDAVKRIIDLKKTPDDKIYINKDSTVTVMLRNLDTGLLQRDNQLWNAYVEALRLKIKNIGSCVSIDRRPMVNEAGVYSDSNDYNTEVIIVIKPQNSAKK